jgi:hypothetical protein
MLDTIFPIFLYEEHPVSLLEFNVLGGEVFGVDSLRVEDLLELETLLLQP